MDLIPAIDIIEGKCVRLSQGDFARQSTYGPAPLDMAKQFEDAGIQRLHVVDLDGARLGKVTNWSSLEAITRSTQLSVDFGGGVKHRDDVQRIIQAGASYVVVGSMAVNNPSIFLEWKEEFGTNRFFIGADVHAGILKTSGWKEGSDLSIEQFLSGYTQKGFDYFFCTDIERDGVFTGPSLQLYKQLLEQFPSIRLVASGGVSSLQDLYDLQQIGCAGAIIGKAIYENRISLKELQQFILQHPSVC
ncbi:MAG: 1-(5-phosphoribosyl)-5-[(5-phosphoribosylamino)methylideneamino]imidazole-4-carboxamide isomerase [Bacteroidota bacterium]